MIDLSYAMRSFTRWLPSVTLFYISNVYFRNRNYVKPSDVVEGCSRSEALPTPEALGDQAELSCL